MSQDGTFQDLMRAAEDQLLLGFEVAARFDHKGLRGSTREEVVAKFLSEQLPGRFGVSSGEAIDADGNRTGQLDIVIFDRSAVAPLLKRASGDLLPAEALLAVIEVKSTLTQKDLNMAAKAAKRISNLRPFGKGFIATRTEGEDFDGRLRCQYSVVAFTSNLSESDWAAREWRRVKKASVAADVAPERLDRVLVLDRGMLLPPFSRARQPTGAGQVMLRDWFLHMANFVQREAARRPAFNFETYGRQASSPGWVDLQ